MIIGIVTEIYNNEHRVALTPDVSARLLHKIIMQKGAGLLAGFADSEYSNVEFFDTSQEVYQKAEVILKIWQPQKAEENYLQKNQTIVAMFDNMTDVGLYQKLNISCFALNLMPRISRAQNMDVLSSQSNLAGYKAVIEACNQLLIAVPLMMTAAGTIPPAKFFVLGIGVGGLQAIATAKRLGAMVFASDIRLETEEQALSLSAKFVKSEDVINKLSDIDVLVTSIPLSDDIKNALSKHCLIKSLVDSNFASEISHSASLLYAKNISNFLGLKFNFEDEIIAKTCINKGL